MVHPSADQNVGPEDVLVLRGGDETGLRAGGEKPLSFRTFWCAPEQLIEVCGREELRLLQASTRVFGTPRLYPAREDLARRCHGLLREVPPEPGLSHRGHLLRIAAEILKHEFEKNRSHRCGFIRMEEHLAQVLKGLSVDDILDLPVSELAEKFGCSRRHLNRLFQEHFGVSANGLRMEMRLLKAVSLLREPKARVIEVAEKCGFNHLGLFNTVFRRRFGVSPRGWRKGKPGADIERVEPANHNPNCGMREKGLCPWAVGDRKPAGPSPTQSQ
jgi:AraC-like DNA-binding protein